MVVGGVVVMDAGVVVVATGGAVMEDGDGAGGDVAGETVFDGDGAGGDVAPGGEVVAVPPVAPVAARGIPLWRTANQTPPTPCPFASPFL